MTLKVRVKQLEEEQAERDARERERCTCELVILEGGEPTPEQEAVLARNATCKADHRGRGFSVVEVPPPPDWMKTRTAEMRESTDQ